MADTPKPTLDAWSGLAEKELRGRPLEDLTWQTPEGIAVKPLYRELNTLGFTFLAAGGVSYTVGAVFYAWKSLKWSHTVWHLFVLAGSLLHFFSILFGIAL